MTLPSMSAQLEALAAEVGLRGRNVVEERVRRMPLDIMSAAQRAEIVFEELQKAPKGMLIRDLADALDWDSYIVRYSLCKLRDEGRVLSYPGRAMLWVAKR